MINLLFSTKLSANEEKIKMLGEIREKLDIIHTSEYSQFLKFMFPIFYNNLRQLPPHFGDSQEQKIRSMSLEIIHRLPCNDKLKMYAPNLMKLVTYLLEVENEANAVTCLRIIIELHKNYRPEMEGEVQAFFDIVFKMYNELPKTLQYFFHEKGPVKALVALQTSQTSLQGSKPSSFIRSTQSFKVLTECPIIVVLLCQIYPKLFVANIQRFIPIILRSLRLVFPDPSKHPLLHSPSPPSNPPPLSGGSLPNPQNAPLPPSSTPPSSLPPSSTPPSLFSNNPQMGALPPQQNPNPKVEGEGGSVGGVGGGDKSGIEREVKQGQIDFVSCQVKSLSLLAYILKEHPETIRQHQDHIPLFVIQLLKNCPQEAAGTRKELLIAIRHILATEYKKAFLPHIGKLLEEETLVGSGVTSFDTVRTIAYSTLAELIHHVRADLTVEQLSTCIHVYTRNLHDNTLHFTLQAMSSKLLLNLVEQMSRKNDPTLRSLLIKILDTYVNKIYSIRKEVSSLLSQLTLYSQPFQQFLSPLLLQLELSSPSLLPPSLLESEKSSYEKNKQKVLRTFSSKSLPLSFPTLFFSHSPKLQKNTFKRLQTND